MAKRSTKIWFLACITFVSSVLTNSVGSKDCDLGIGVGCFDLCGYRVFRSRARMHQAGVGRLDLLN